MLLPLVALAAETRPAFRLGGRKNTSTVSALISLLSFFDIWSSLVTFLDLLSVLVLHACSALL